MSQLPAHQLNQSTQQQRYGGCLLAIMLLILLPLLFIGGQRVLPIMTSLGGIRGEESIVAILNGLIGLSCLLILVFVFLAKQFELAKGIGASLFFLALYVVAITLFRFIEGEMPYPGLPDFALYLLLIPVVIFMTARAVPIPYRIGSVFSGLATLLGGIGMWLSLPFAFAGSLGTWGEIGLALIEGAALGTVWGTAVWLIFAWDRAFPKRHRWWSFIMSAGFGAAFGPIVLTGHGGYSQSILLSIGLLFAALPAALFLFLPERLEHSHRWGPLTLFGTLFLTVQLLSFEGLELEFMAEELLMTGGVAVLITTLLAIILTLLGLFTARGNPAPWVGMTLMVGALIVGVIGFLTATGPLVQPTSRFLLLAEQANTTDLPAIEDRQARVETGYDRLVTHAEESQQALVTYLEENEIPYTRFYLVNGLEISATPLQAWRIARRDEVASVIDSPQTRPLRRWNWLPGTDEIVGNLLGEEPPAAGEVTWGIEMIEADRVWEELGITGENIVIGGADSGVDWTHPALRDNYRGSDGDHNYNWFDPALGATEPIDQNMHGTHTAGTHSGQGGIGVAPGSTWIACRNLPRNLGNPADYIACMQFLFAPFPLGGDPFSDGRPELGAHVTNNSWGCPPEEGCDGETLGIGIEHLRNMGQMMVVSNGNDGPGCETTGAPAATDGAFSVGASNPNGSPAAFSSRGPAVDIDGDLIAKPDLIAPGVDVISSIPGGGYAATPGTSMASPHLAGVVALIWSANPDLIGQIDETEAILRRTARPIVFGLTACDPETGVGKYENNTMGAGFVDAFEAVSAALNR